MALFGRKKDDTEAPESPVVPVPEPQPVVMTRRSLDEQRAFVLDRIEPMRPFGMQIWDVPGLVLCEDIASDLDLPLVTTARVAGWGVRGSDLVGATAERKKSLYVVDAIGEGQSAGAPLVAGAAVRVAAGAIVPEGVDAVVPESAGRQSGPDVLVGSEVRLWENLRRAGSELADGTPLLRAGEVLTPRSVAVLAEVGLDKVLVRPRPRVVVLTVGDSLVAPGQPLTAPHQRYDSTTALVTASARADGATVYPLGIVAASEADIRRAIADQEIRADLIVVVGGGEQLRGLLGGLGEFDDAEVTVNRVGRFAFAEVGERRVPLLALPGGAVSAFVGYHAFVRPAINRLNDVDPLAGPRVDGELVEEIASTEGVTDLVPAVRDEQGRVRPVAAADSELAFDLARANVLAVIPAEWGGARAGSRVECLVLDDAPTPAR